MLPQHVSDFSRHIEPDRVRKECCTDPGVFDLEMQRIHETVWIYCGHESQVPTAGDYYTVQIGREPMIMVRAQDGKVNVLCNRCPTAARGAWPRALRSDSPSAGHRGPSTKSHEEPQAIRRRPPTCAGSIRMRG